MEETQHTKVRNSRDEIVMKERENVGEREKRELFN